MLILEKLELTSSLYAEFIAQVFINQLIKFLWKLSLPKLGFSVEPLCYTSTF